MKGFTRRLEKQEATQLGSGFLGVGRFNETEAKATASCSANVGLSVVSRLGLAEMGDGSGAERREEIQADVGPSLRRGDDGHRRFNGVTYSLSSTNV